MAPANHRLKAPGPIGETNNGRANQDHHQHLCGAHRRRRDLAGSARAQDCPRGDLDKAYCDRNGDLVADAPTDPKQARQSVDADLRLHAGRGPGRLQKVWDGFIKHLEKVTGKKVVFFPVQSNAAQIEAMRSGRLHVAGVNTGGNPLAVNCAGFVPFAMMAAQGRQLRLRDGNHRAGRQPDQDAGRPQGQEGRVHRRRPRTPASRRRRRS